MAYDTVSQINKDYVKYVRHCVRYIRHYVMYERHYVIYMKYYVKYAIYYVRFVRHYVKYVIFVWIMSDIYDILCQICKTLC